MNDWALVYEGFDPAQEGLRETLCTLGNGYFATRAAATDAAADDVHYPGTYLAGGYDRLVSRVAGRDIENEDLVNLPNWLVLAVRLDEGPWLGPGDVEILEYRQELDLRQGLLRRSRRVRDARGRTWRWDERRLVSMHDPHVAALEVRITPENWSGRLVVRSGLDGGVTNAGVARYRALEGRHLETLDTGRPCGGTIWLRSRMVQSRREIVEAARTRIVDGGAPEAPDWHLERDADRIAEHIEVEAAAGREIVVEKVVALHTSRDTAVSEPGLAALERVAHAGSFDALLEDQRRAWALIWDECDIRIAAHGDAGAQMKLRLHIFHLLQTVSRHSIDLDVGAPPRGWHGEAYRGHIMWDELFIFPYLNLHQPALTRALLRYRFRRLDRARTAAAAAGGRGAMFPWQSGSDGREESQRVHLNPMSGRWIADNSYRQRHINAAVVYNVWQYVQVTDDREFLCEAGAELVLEVARFFAGLARFDEVTGRFTIEGVMGPDEFHTAYPGVDPTTSGGLANNAYTNVMASWVLTRALEVLEILPEDRRRELRTRLVLEDAESRRWDEISRGLLVPFHDEGIISQFQGYGALEEFDWDAYRAQYGETQRLDRILESEGKDPNLYKVSKQADALMLFFLFSTEELVEIFERLGYDFTPDLISRNIHYYLQRTSHGSTLSWVTHAWVLARADRPRSWRLFCQALDSDFADLQGGTTPEGIHLGAMAGTVDMVQRAYTGIETRANLLAFNPGLPEELTRLETTIRYRGQTLELSVTRERLIVACRPSSGPPVTIAYRGQVRQIGPGQRYEFTLIQPKPRDRTTKARDREDLRRRGPDVAGGAEGGIVR